LSASAQKKLSQMIQEAIASRRLLVNLSDSDWTDLRAGLVGMEPRLVEQSPGLAGLRDL
jgi:hypothetical protein